MPEIVRRPAQVVPIPIFAVICLWPYGSRLRWPTLYADDIDRVAQLQTGTLGAILFQPFNEHLAPLFQGVSWVTWHLAGGRLARAPLAFTAASFLPFAMTLPLLARVLRREAGSGAGAMAGVAVFAVSWLAVETVYWYSASSFMWALLATLVAWEASAGRGWWRRAVAALAAAAAPGFSMIGILAGPSAALRAVAAGGRKAWPGALAALAGSLAFLAVYAACHDRAVVATTVSENAGIWPGLAAASRAPAAALVPAVFGLRTLPASGRPGAILTGLTLSAAAGLLVRAYRKPAERPAILGGLFLIAGGYALTFCARAGVPGRALLEIQRYHLFPMLGLVLLLAPAFGRAFRRWDDRPALSLWAAAGLAAALLILHRHEMHGRARFLRFPDQAQTLAALDRLGDLCARSGVTRAQALAALDPVEADWAPAGRSVLVMLGPCAPSPHIPDALVKTTLLNGLSPADRRALEGPRLAGKPRPERRRHRE